jgi:hypothetical protein
MPLPASPGPRLRWKALPELTRIRLWRQFKPFVYLNVFPAAEKSPIDQPSC